MAGVWTSGGNLNTARSNLSGAGTQTAGLSFGGTTGSVSAVTETYDGASWSSGGALSTARTSLAAAGTQTAGLSIGGYTTASVANTEEFDGSVWTAGGNLNTARYVLAGCGTQSAALSFGGTTGSVSTATETYDGAAWSSGAALGTARSSLAGAGSQTAGLSFGGFATVNLASTEEFDGSAWAAGGDLGTPRRGLAGGGAQTAGLSFGGLTESTVASTEEYDSAAWSVSGDLATARRFLAGAGTPTAGLSFGGTNAANTRIATTEEYTGEGPSMQAYPTGLAAIAAVGTPTATGAASATPAGVYAMAALGVVDEYPRIGYLALPGPLGTPALVGSLLVYGQMAAAGPLGTPALRGFHDFTAVVGDVETYYVMDITGDPVTRIPITSWQATLHATQQSYLQAVIPAASQWYALLAARLTAGESFEIRRGARLPSGLTVEQLMASATLQQVRADQGWARHTVTLASYGPPVVTASPVTRAIQQIQLVSTNGSSARLRGAVDWTLQPGDTATGGGLSFTVKYLNYYVGDGGAYMDVGS